MQQRIITGIYLALFAIVWLFILPIDMFKLILVGVAFIGMYEWLYTYGLHERYHLKGYFGLFSLIVFQSYYPAFILLTASITVGFYAISLKRIILFEKHRLDVTDKRDNVFSLFKGVIILATFTNILMVWRDLPSLDSALSGTAMIVLTALIIVASDVGAYFTGKAIGKHKLCPHTSPKKTWEGLIGGLICSCLASFLFIKFFSVNSPFYSIAPALIISVTSVLGDLTISLSKRIYGIKDTGNILPGHGGILDRLDGWLIAFPVAYLLF